MLAIGALILNPAYIAVDRVLARLYNLNTVGNPLFHESLRIEFETYIVIRYRNAVALVNSESLACLCNRSQGCTRLKHELFCCHRITSLAPDFGILLEKFNIKCILLATLQLGCDAQLDTLCHTRIY